MDNTQSTHQRTMRACPLHQRLWCTPNSRKQRRRKIDLPMLFATSIVSGDEWMIGRTFISGYIAQMIIDAFNIIQTGLYGLQSLHRHIIAETINPTTTTTNNARFRWSHKNSTTIQLSSNFQSLFFDDLDDVSDKKQRPRRLIRQQHLVERRRQQQHLLTAKSDNDDLDAIC